MRSEHRRPRGMPAPTSPPTPGPQVPGPLGSAPPLHAACFPPSTQPPASPSSHTWGMESTIAAPTDALPGAPLGPIHTQRPALPLGLSVHLPVSPTHLGRHPKASPPLTLIPDAWPCDRHAEGAQLVLTEGGNEWQMNKWSCFCSMKALNAADQSYIHSSVPARRSLH